MDTTMTGPMIVPYAADTLAQATCRATVDVAGRGWRINSAPLGGDPVMADGDVFAAVGAQITEECGPWNMAAQRVVARYFAWIDESVEAARADIEPQLAVYRGLFSYRDFRFSAPRPLPRAYLPLEGENAGDVEVEIAFLPGDGRIVALLGRGRMTLRRENERRERLVASGVEIVAIEQAGAEMFARLAAPQRPFWAGEVLPCGPLRPAMLA